MTSSLASSDSLPDYIDLNTIPARALNVSSRMTLSWYLNPEQPLRSAHGITRDYRGLAEQMGFEYYDIKNFQRNEDPTLKILESWEGKPKNSVGLLVEFLENMERHDVLEDIVPQFKKDAMAHLRNKKVTENPIQVPEVTSGPLATFQTENPGALTLGDVASGGCTYYDAYVCYAEEDTGFVCELARYLESPQIGIKLFIKGRDLLLGTSEPDSYATLIRERCNRMLIILSPRFLESPACEFQTSFATGLAIEQRQRKLIPIIIAPCEIPDILRFVSKIDFTKPNVPDWLWEKLIQSIRGTTSTIFVSPPVGIASSGRLPGSSQCMLGSSSYTNPLITFPPTISHPQVVASSSPPLALTMEASHVESTASSPKKLNTASTVTHKVSPTTKNKWYHSLKERITSFSSASTAHASSTATSGYHSQSSFILDSTDDSELQNDIYEATV